MTNTEKIASCAIADLAYAVGVIQGLGEKTEYLSKRLTAYLEMIVEMDSPMEELMDNEPECKEDGLNKTNSVA